MKEIHATIVGGGTYGQNLYQCRVVLCDHYDSCSLYKIGRCLGVGGLSLRCPYAHINFIDGYSKRSSKYGAWEREQKSLPYYDALRSPSGMVVAVIGDMMLSNMYPYVSFDNHLGWWVNTKRFENDYAFIPLDWITPSLLEALYFFRYKWPTENSPDRDRWFARFSLVLPEKYSEFIKANPEIEVEPDYSLLEAYAETLPDGAKVWLKSRTVNGAQGTKIGDEIITASVSYTICGVRHPTELHIKINPKTVVRILNNDSIGPNTKFLEMVD